MSAVVLVAGPLSAVVLVAGPLSAVVLVAGSPPLFSVFVLGVGTPSF